ncbi:MAG TPA: L-threonylcarbamoyladenylate synthase [Methylomirabilota bacterium]|jgi:L-threonylcarbamoyladenylate synthase|nr:L-threonylcarbamoyladenylate synthase [Methylomirabilota bacterium]
MGTEVLKVDPANPDAAALQRGAAALKKGGLVAYPTETFYGLGAAALDGGAVRRIFEVKRRPESKPLLVLVDSVEMVERLAVISEPARRLMAQHWPGALTLVLPAQPSVPVEVTAGTGTVGVRLSLHPIARGLARALGGPVTAPSANRSDDPPPTTADAVLRDLDGAIALVLDGGPTAGGLASTVLDVTVDPPRVIRQGAVRVI